MKVGDFAVVTGDDADWGHHFKTGTLVRIMEGAGGGWMVRGVKDELEEWCVHGDDLRPVEEAVYAAMDERQRLEGEDTEAGYPRLRIDDEATVIETLWRLRHSFTAGTKVTVVGILAGLGDNGADIIDCRDEHGRQEPIYRACLRLEERPHVREVQQWLVEGSRKPLNGCRNNDCPCQGSKEGAK